MIQEFTLDKINQIALSLIKNINKIDVGHATILALHGDLGAGKTTLTKELAKILGVENEIISPTFVIMKKYKIKDKKFKNLIHIDAYRLKNSQELFVLGWEDISKDKENLIIIEWPEIVPECLDGQICKVFLSHIDEETRSIEICYN